MNDKWPGQESESILIVDDTPANLNLLTEILRERGLKARPVPSGELALQAAVASPPDLVLLDIDMPEMNGFEVCRRLKSDPNLRDIPIIFISALTALSDKVQGFALGGVDYITKPFQQEEVNARVSAHLELRRQRREIQRSYERLHELEQLRSKLVHMVVHDLRSPLTAICSLLYSVRVEPDVPAQAIEDLEVALSAAMDMSAMITSALEVNKIEEGAVQLQLRTANVVDIVQSVLSDMRGIIGARTIELESPVCSIPAKVDNELIVRVLQNLLGNALKFAPRKAHVRVVVETAGEYVRIRVADEGPAIPQEYHRKIFERLAHGESGAKAPSRSTGLGLAFCKFAVQAHGGEIGVESDPSKVGNSFWFTLRRLDPALV